MYHNTNRLLSNCVSETKDTILSCDSANDYVPKSILILGNGFDIDLGIKTKYSQFANSIDWPFKESVIYEEDSLPFFLNDKKKHVDTWFDLEEVLANYASRGVRLSDEKVAKTKEDFNLLVKSLVGYLIKQEDCFAQAMRNATAHVRAMKPSHYVLQYFIKKKKKKIYTFNYTNAFYLANQIILSFRENIIHVHGSARRNNIILGVGDQKKLDDEYFEFYKSASPFYRSNSLVEDLNAADEVYIFGHSLGRNDYAYFSDFFLRWQVNPQFVHLHRLKSR